MINKKELRIGNYITDKSLGMLKIIELRRDYCGVDAIDFHYKCDYTDISPILLTSKILKKIGFKWLKNEYPGWYKKSRNKKFTIRIWGDDEHDFIWSVNEYYAINLSSIHQLQNLYYSLTGEEL